MKFIILLVLILNHSFIYASERKCISIYDFNKILKELGGKEYMHFQLNKKEKSNHLIFIESEKSILPSLRKWIFLSKYSDERPDIYCITAQGNGIGLLPSLHQNSLEDKWGLPGSGYPRCATKNDLLGSLRLRGWANKELGASLVFELNINEKHSFVLLISEVGGYWILIEEKPNEDTCYWDRGEGSKFSDIKVLH